jgi:hypothetical protein
MQKVATVTRGLLGHRFSVWSRGSIESPIG